jgi:regulator of replication initiation timing
MVKQTYVLYDLFENKIMDTYTDFDELQQDIEDLIDSNINSLINTLTEKLDTKNEDRYKKIIIQLQQQLYNKNHNVKLRWITIEDKNIGRYIYFSLIDDMKAFYYDLIK